MKVHKLFTFPQCALCSSVEIMEIYCHTTFFFANCKITFYQYCSITYCISCYLKSTDGNGANSLVCRTKAKRQWTLQRRGESFRKSECDLRPSICSHFWTISTNHAKTEERGRIAGRSKRSTKRYVKIVVWKLREISLTRTFLSKILWKQHLSFTKEVTKKLISWNFFGEWERNFRFPTLWHTQ